MWNKIYSPDYGGYAWKNNDGDILMIRNSNDVGLSYVTLTKKYLSPLTPSTITISKYYLLNRKPIGKIATLRYNYIKNNYDWIYGSLINSIKYAKYYMKNHK